MADDLIIHCAVMAAPSRESKELLEYLAETCPGSLEKRDSDGNTPLMTACILGRRQAVKTLIAANADQAAKNHKGENMVHALLRYKTKPHRLEAILNLFDQDLLKNHLFQQRKNLQENGNAPIHSWISKAVGIDENAFTAPKPRYNYYYHNNNNNSYSLSPVEEKEMLTLLLKYTSGKELELLNGAGDTPLHTAIMKDCVPITNVLVKHKPELLYRENAVGRTPFEIAQSRVAEKQFKRPEGANRGDQDKSADNLLENHRDQKNKKSSSAEMFDAKRREDIVAEFGLSGEYQTTELYAIAGALGFALGSSDKHKSNDHKLSDEMIATVMLDLCTTAMKQHPANRRLVSLNEANDVAKRLGERFVGSRYFSVQARAEDEDGEEDEEKDFQDEAKKGNKADFVAQTMKNTSRYWNRWEEPDDSLKEYLEKCEVCKHWHE
jgi:ankyrin repeat protein